MPADYDRVLIDGAAQLGLSLTNEQVITFTIYIQELNSWGKKINLLSRIDPQEIIIKDFLDSLTVLKHLTPGSSILDLGSGAGFPGIPLKIVRPDLKLVLLEATRKKVYFLKDLVRALGIEKIEVYWSWKGKEMGQNFQGTFDFVISRAFGSLRKFSAAGAPFLRCGGILLAMKGKKGQEELNKEIPDLAKEGLKMAFLDRFCLPLLGHERILIGLRKE